MKLVVVVVVFVAAGGCRERANATSSLSDQFSRSDSVGSRDEMKKCCTYLSPDAVVVLAKLPRRVMMVVVVVSWARSMVMMMLGKELEM